MNRDTQKALLAAAGRYIRGLFGEIEPRIKAVEEVAAEVPALVEKAVAALPAPKDGVSLTKADVEPMLREMVEALPKPKDADPVDAEAVAADVAKRLLASEGLKAICDLVAGEAVAALPLPEKGDRGLDGKSVVLDEVLAALLPRLQAHVDAEVANAVLDVERRAQGVLERAIAAIPKPQDGRDGLDGLGFDDMTASYDGERAVTLKFQRGDLVKTFEINLPVVIDRGYWREGTAAKAGDGWTHDGTWWIAQRDTKAAPALDSADWRIGARKGRDGVRGPAGKDYVAPGPVKLS